MMQQNFDPSLTLVLKEEGGFVNNPKDPGGMTNLGVTARVWEAFTGQPADEAAMRALTPAAVTPLYRQNYWNKVQCDQLPAGVDYAVMDVAVNSGVGRAAKFLQQACGVNANGVIDDATLAAANAAAPQDLVNQICDARMAFLESLTTFATFGKGWTARVARVRAAGTQMAAPPATGSTPD
jgi:lysozyme family protein